MQKHNSQRKKLFNETSPQFAIWHIVSQVNKSIQQNPLHGFFLHILSRIFWTPALRFCSWMVSRLCEIFDCRLWQQVSNITNTWCVITDVNSLMTDETTFVPQFFITFWTRASFSSWGLGWHWGLTALGPSTDNLNNLESVSVILHWALCQKTTEPKEKELCYGSSDCPQMDKEFRTSRTFATSFFYCSESSYCTLHLDISYWSPVSGHRQALFRWCQHLILQIICLMPI